MSTKGVGTVPSESCPSVPRVDIYNYFLQLLEECANNDACSSKQLQAFISIFLRISISFEFFTEKEARKIIEPFKDEFVLRDACKPVSFDAVRVLFYRTVHLNIESVQALCASFRAEFLKKEA